MSLADLIHRAHSGEPLVAVGLMAGTSADGIDAGVARITQRRGRMEMEELAFRSTPYESRLRRRLLAAFQGHAAPSEICALNRDIGLAFAAEAEEAAAQAGIPIDFAASHGQTVWHIPPDAGLRGATLQVGEASCIAQALRVPVISDFRQADMALGGHGAPLAPIIDFMLLTHPTEARVVVNIGGIANLTTLPAGASADEVIAFDTGPGNVLMDEAVRRITGGSKEFDRDGRLAAQSPPDESEVDRLLAHPYFSQPPPKSTGRELFTVAMVDQLLVRGLSGSRLVSTLTELTARTIAGACRWISPADAWYLGGGGAENVELVRRLKRLIAPARVERVEAIGLRAESKEAMLFALLGYLCLAGRTGTLAKTTGAGAPAHLGKICLPP